MSAYAIGEPRGSSLHPNSPDFDDRLSTYIDKLVCDGEALLAHRPHELCEVLSRAPVAHQAAIADLLRPLWIDQRLQNQRLRALAQWLKANEATAELAAEIADDEADAAAADEAECSADYD